MNFGIQIRQETIRFNTVSNVKVMGRLTRLCYVTHLNVSCFEPYHRTVGIGQGSNLETLRKTLHWLGGMRQTSGNWPVVCLGPGRHRVVCPTSGLGMDPMINPSSWSPARTDKCKLWCILFIIFIISLHLFLNWIYLDIYIYKIYLT